MILRWKEGITADRNKSQIACEADSDKRHVSAATDDDDNESKR